MTTLDIDAGSFKDWLAQLDHVRNQGSGEQSTVALFLDEIEGGEHRIRTDVDGTLIAGLSYRSLPTARLDPGQYMPLPSWAASFICHMNALERYMSTEDLSSGRHARAVIEKVLEEEDI